MLRIGQNQGLKTTADIDRFFFNIEAFPIHLEEDTQARAWPDILTLARAHSLTVYNAAYLELSLRLKLPLATIDATLSHAAHASGVSIFTP
ncbi:MAG: type II toxin-antitoxin system VapC family toxin [Gemmataceae bacterium]